MDSPGPRENVDQLTVTSVAANGIHWIVVRGEVDLTNHAELRSSLAGIQLGAARMVILDLRWLSFCDSVGCQILSSFRKQTAAADYHVRMQAARPIIRRVFSLLDESNLD